MSKDLTATLTINGDASKGASVGLTKGILRTALDIKAKAKDLAPVDQGRLKGSIEIQSIEGEDAVRVGTPVTYAPYQEFGTRHMRPQPFMRPARRLASGKSLAGTKLWIQIEVAKSLLTSKVRKVFK